MTMHNKRKIKMADLPFCRQPWHIGAMLLGFGFAFTVAWAFHLLHDMEDELALTRFIKTHHAKFVPPPKQENPDVIPAAQNRFMTQNGLMTQNGPMTQNGVTASIPPGMIPADMRVRAALVNIAGTRRVDGQGSSQFVTAGSGVLVTANGYVATAAHVIQTLKEILIRVQTPSGPRQYTAQLVKIAPTHDLAVLKLVSRDLFPYLPLVPEISVFKPGEPVIAWGDPNGTNAMVNRGLIRQVDVAAVVGSYSLTHLLQTDAVSHWSHSGGPLVDRDGRVIGINIVAQSAAGVVGYAVPADVLLAHFQDVVTFPMARTLPTPVVGAVPAPPVAAGVAAALAVRPGGNMGNDLRRGGRRSDAWWAQAQAEYGLSKGRGQPPFADMGVHVAAWQPHVPPAQMPQPKVLPVSHATEQPFWGYSLETLLGLLALGLISGISGGMMTMGGGIIKVTGLLLFFGYGMLLIRPVAYITNIFLYGAAVLRYRRYNLITWGSVRALIPWAMIGVVLGYFIGNVIGTLFIRYLLGVFAALVGVRMLVEIVTDRQQKQREWQEDLHPERIKRKPTAAALRYFGMGDPPTESGISAGDCGAARAGMLGLPMGIISGILGITGGVVEVPLQRYVVGVPLRNAIANSAVLVFCASSVGSVVAMAHGIQTGAFDWSAPVKLAVILIPGAYVGGWIGAWLTKIVPVGVLRWLYALLMFVITVRMFLS